MRNIIITLRNTINQRVNEYGEQYTAFGVIGLMIYPLFYYISQHYAPIQDSHFNLRVAATALCLPLVLSSYWPQFLRKWLASYWYLTLLYCLPFLFTILLLEKHDGNPTWVVSMPFLLLWLMVLVDDLSFIILFTVGTVLGLIAANFLFSVDINRTDYFIILSQYAIFLSATMYLSYCKEQFNTIHNKTLAIKPIAAGIAHEIRTPLASISAGAGGVKQYLPTLLDAYQQAKDHGLPVGIIRDIHFRQLNETLDKVIRETHYANTIIDMMLMQVNHSAINIHRFQLHSIRDCINEALNRYPFIANTREKLIEWDDRNDFMFYGDKILFIHMIFNLLKNAIYFVAEADKGRIYIWLEQHKTHNCLHFKDTGTGVPDENINNIFKNFYTTTPNGTGIGLAFCKTVIESMQGEITCESVYGEYTEFTVTFPLHTDVDIDHKTI